MCLIGEPYLCVILYLLDCYPIQVSVLHASLLPQERDTVMDDFRAGRTKVS